MNEQVILECICSTKKNHFQTKKDIQYDFTGSSFLIIRINNYKANFDGQQQNKINFVNLESLPINIVNFQSDKVKIFNNYFKLIAAVYHFGTLNNGHFTCRLRVKRKEKDDWISISDNKSQKCKDPANENLKNVYYIILEKLN